MPAVRADQLSGKQRCLGRRIVSGNLFRRLIDFLDSLPQLRPIIASVRALMGNPFRFRFPYHGLILIGTGTGAVLCERTGINIIVQKASDGCVSPQPGILAAAISVMDRQYQRGGRIPFSFRRQRFSHRPCRTDASGISAAQQRRIPRQ